MLQWRLRLLSLLPVLGCVALFVVLGYWFDARAHRGLGRDEAAAYQGQIQVVEDRMLFGQSAGGPTVFVVGMLRNDSDVTWEQINVEVQFLDPEGGLFDVEVEEHYLERILPHGEMAFKLRTVADRPTEEYASYEVYVRSAEDARIWP